MHYYEILCVLFFILLCIIITNVHRKFDYNFVIFPSSDDIVEDLTTGNPDLMDVEDDESSPVTATTPSNGNVPINPIVDKPNFINQNNGVSLTVVGLLYIIKLKFIEYRNRRQY